MANYKGHIAGGLVTGIVYVGATQFLPSNYSAYTSGILQDNQMLAGLLIISMLFALWPDIDTNSKGQDIFFGMAFVVDVFLIATGHIEAAAYFGLLAMFPILGKHRGWTHTKWAMLLVPSPIVLVPYLYRESILDTSLIFYGAAVAGYFSHLLLDGLIVKWIRVKN